MNRAEQVEKAASKLRTQVLWCNDCDGDKCSACDERASEFTYTVLDAILPQIATTTELEALSAWSWLAAPLDGGDAWMFRWTGLELQDAQRGDVRELDWIVGLFGPLTVVWTK